MNLEERIILWLVQHEVASEERDLLNDALEELEQAREQLKSISDGVNRRCGADINQLPLVSLDKLTARLAAAEASESTLRGLLREAWDNYAFHNGECARHDNSTARRRLGKLVGRDFGG